MRRSNGVCDCDRHPLLTGVVCVFRGTDRVRGAGEADRGARCSSSSRSRHNSASARTARSGLCVKIWTSQLPQTGIAGPPHPRCTHEFSSDLSCVSLTRVTMRVDPPCRAHPWLRSSLHYKLSRKGPTDRVSAGLFGSSEPTHLYTQSIPISCRLIQSTNVDLHLISQPKPPPC